MLYCVYFSDRMNAMNAMVKKGRVFPFSLGNRKNFDELGAEPGV